ncbi:MAG: nitrate- and nitrite sensing domain-containing protein [Magnetococcales bacterium]|nr:nitrate- and nitrite sensing domain-containing protein [Magnetococcales bacterium]
MGTPMAATQPRFIQNRWLFMLLPALLVVVGYVWSHLLDEWHNWQRAERVVHLSGNVFPLVDLLYALQKERGYSIGLLASAGQSFRTPLAEQRVQTDGYVRALAALSHDAPVDEEDHMQHELFATLLQRMESLQQMRQRVESGVAAERKVSADEAESIKADYTESIHTLLKTIGRLLAQTADIDLVDRFINLPTLFYVSEILGKERVLLTQVFAADRFVPGVYEQWQALQNERNAYLEIVSAFSPSQSQEFFSDLEKEVAQAQAQADHLRRLAMARHEQGGFRVDPQRWFELSTRIIDLLQERGKRLQQASQAQAKKRLYWAAWKFWGQVGASLVLMLAVGALALVALLTARSRLLQREVAERAQREAELRTLHHALDQTPLTVVITALQGEIEYANRTCFQHTGYEPAELLGQNPRLLKSGHTDPAIYANLWQTITAGELWQGEFHNRKKDGTLFWEAASISPIRDLEGNISHFLAVKEDITEKKRLEKEYNDRRTLLEKVAVGVPLVEIYALLQQYVEERFPGVLTCVAQVERPHNRLRCVVAPRLQEESVEPLCCCSMMQDLSIQELGENILCGQAIHRKALVQVDNLFQHPHRLPSEKVLRRQGLQCGWSLPIIGEKEEVLGVLTGYCPRSPQPDDSLTLNRMLPLVQLVGIAINRQQREEALSQAARQAQAANQAKSAFLANMSHEIRTPLHAVIGSLELLQAGATGDDRREHLQLAHGGARTLLFLLNDLLDYAKIEAGQLHLDLLPLDPKGILAEVVANLTPLARKKGLQVTQAFVDDPSPPSPPLVVLGDPIRLKQILLNLLGNAIKFTHQGGRIDLLGQWGARQGEKAQTLLFEVRDTGVGIPVAQREQIFERFTQAEEGTARRFGGTGLGLAICRDLVTLMGGTIGVEENSAAPGGSRFYFSITVQLEAVQQTTPPVEPAPPPTRDLAAATILVVDDQQTNLKVTQSMLVKLGCQRANVMCASGGQEALERFQATRFELVLMDCQMPVMDGYQASRAMRAWEQEQGRKPVPIIAFTADVTEESRQQGEAAGMSGFLRKPLFLAPLQEMLETYIVKK